MSFRSLDSKLAPKEKFVEARLKVGRSQLNTEIDQGTRGLEEEHSPFGYGRS